MTMQPEELKAIRKDLNISQAQMGEALGLTGQYIGFMENGKAAIEPRTHLAAQLLGRRRRFQKDLDDARTVIAAIENGTTYLEGRGAQMVDVTTQQLEQAQDRATLYADLIASIDKELKPDER
jgi:transcriptional regulator with XRE-family HTH domain